MNEVSGHARIIATSIAIAVFGSLTTMAVHEGWMGQSPFWLAFFAAIAVWGFGHLFVYIIWYFIPALIQFDKDHFIDDFNADEILRDMINGSIEQNNNREQLLQAIAPSKQTLEQIADAIEEGRISKTMPLTQRTLDAVGISRFAKSDNAAIAIEWLRKKGYLNPDDRWTVSGLLAMGVPYPTAVSHENSGATSGTTTGAPEE